MDPAALFHPAVAGWFAQRLGTPTPAQADAWPLIQAGRNVLISAPTGAGKTLAAFLAAIDALVRKGLEAPLTDVTHVVYVSPLKALSNDVHANLEVPLAGIRAALAARGEPDVDIRTLVRTGDTPQADRAAMRKRPPHIVVTTPESLYILLGSESGRRMLATTRTVIVDEIHAIAGSKRGSHLALTLERLDALAGTPPVRIGLSATQRPIEDVARLLVGVAEGHPRACSIVDHGHGQARDLALELPRSPLSAVMSHEVWEEVYGRLAELATLHRTTLVFVNTRRMAERAARHLTERLGAGAVMAHHGSMARELRLTAEQRLKRGELRLLVATASLELGLDIGDVDLVCQLGSPRSIATFLQRAGRARHQVGGVPKARLFPLSRDELCECAALLEAVGAGELDRLRIPHAPRDVLAQQIVAEVAAGEWREDALFDLVRRASPYAGLDRPAFQDIVRMLSEGVGRSRGSAYLHRDAVNGMLRARRGARLTALTSGGAIPDTADYDVVLEPAGTPVGTVNEDFAVESLAGDVFQLGNTSYRIRRVEAGRVRVEDAQGAAPTIPFWLGEAPARTRELSAAVSRLRERVAGALAHRGADAARVELAAHAGEAPAEQVVAHLAAAHVLLGTLPTQKRVVLERFFDESGGMQLVIHAPFGSRINRAWGLALRKRFCVRFNFELQAAATEDAIVLSLSQSHSFPLADVARYLHPSSVREVLVQATLAAPMFVARWRWIAATALALPRFRGGRKVPAPLMRMRAEDLMASVFPDQVACAENLNGPREVPDHPLVQQALDDCLHDAMDLDGLVDVLRGIEAGAIEVVARDLPAPSPLALEVLSARPYAYLDDAPLEERRAHAVMSRRWQAADDAAHDAGALDAAAIAAVRSAAWPQARDADELHDALLTLGCLSQEELDAQAQWAAFALALAGMRRATALSVTTPEGVATTLWVAAERLPQFVVVHPHARMQPAIAAPVEHAAQAWTAEAALTEMVRGRIEVAGPVTAVTLARCLGVDVGAVREALARLVAEGAVLQGRYTPGRDADGAQDEWCDRGLLARIHRATLTRLRREIEPVAARDFMRFLLRWQHMLTEERREGVEALSAVVGALEGFEAPAGAWETELLPARLRDYDMSWLDDLCLAGRAAWSRLAVAASSDAAAPIRTTPVTLMPRRTAALWARVAQAASTPAPAAAAGSSPAGSGQAGSGQADVIEPTSGAAPRGRAARVAALLHAHGASFFDEIVEGTGLMRTEVESALGELVSRGSVSSDSFAGLRALLTPSAKRKRFGHRRGGAIGIEDAGRWSLVRRAPLARSGPLQHAAEDVEHVAFALLRRYGVICARLLAREAAWLPPWRDLLRVLRRLEARGDVRGGRFIADVSGEQFALPDAVALLREVRRAPANGAITCVSAADPLNLLGTLLPGTRIPALATNRIALRDGEPVAALVAGTLTWLAPHVGDDARSVEDALRRRHGGVPRLAYPR